MAEKKGITLIEVVITIAVVIILFIILSPLISSNIEHARVARAAADVDRIGKAILKFRYDVGQWPISNYSGNPNPKQNLLFGDGKRLWDKQDKKHLKYFLKDNSGNFPTPKKGKAKGKPVWRGPYLYRFNPDPFGNAYLVNSQYFDVAKRRVWILSPGKNQSIEASFDGSKALPSESDDIVFRLQ